MATSRSSRSPSRGRSARGKSGGNADAESSSTKSSSRGSKSGDGTPSSMILQLVSSAMGDSLSDVVGNLKTKVAEQVTVHGDAYLDAAREHISDATAKVVEWGKKHPVKTVAAAAALVAVSGFLYATLNGKMGKMAQAGKASGR
jgi:hypothetical protein